MIKQVFGCLIVVAMSIALVGCGNKPKIPANTVAAAYVDLEEMIDQGKDIVESFIDVVENKEYKALFERNYKEALEQFEKTIMPCQPQWAVVTFGLGTGGNPEIAAVVRCDYEKCENFMAYFKQDSSVKTVDGCQGIDFMNAYSSPVDMPVQCFLVDSQYLLFVASPNESFAKRMIALYKNGDGETSSSFGNLCDLDDGAVMRIQTADMETICAVAAPFIDLKGKIQQLGESADDEDLAEMVLDMGQISLDVIFSSDTLGTKVTVDAGSRELARHVESLFDLLGFANRVSVDVGCGLINSPFIKEMFSQNMFLKDMPPLETETLRELAHLVRESIEVDRDGSEATLKITYDVDDLFEVLVPSLIK